MDELPEGFDLEALLAPIADDRQVGADLREDFSPSSLYYRLRDARAEARAAERAADSDAELDGAPPPQWRTIRELASQALREATKDLEIAAWYTEALLRSEGLRGLTAGFRLMGGLAAQYWDDLYPAPDEDGIATKVAPVTGLNGEGGDGTLIQPLRKLPLYPRADGSMLAFWQYEQAQEVSGIGDAARKQQRLDAGVLPFDTVENEARAAGSSRFATLRAQARAASEAWRAMSETLDTKAGTDSPPTSRVRDLLGAIIEVAERYAPADSSEGTDLPDVAGVISDGVTATGVPGVAVTAPGRLATREDALRALNDIADFFRRAEPHSPMAYTLQEAVRRGRLTWPELLAEIVPDSSSRHAILSSLGIRPPPEEE
jgi:type VI secretion system protein ImpA